MSDGSDPAELQRRLERLAVALSSERTPSAARSAAPGRSRGAPAVPVLAIGLALIAVGVATGQPWWIVAAGVLVTIGGLGLALAKLTGGAPGRPHIGIGATVEASAVIEPGATVQMGATVEAGAVVEPGATVEMGATLRAGAVVKRGAVVRMGATVHAGATLEADAVVGWGADVMEGATVGAGARVGTGATVNRNAVVPAGLRMMPGSTWAQGAAVSQREAAAPVIDPRSARIEAACRKIEVELQQAPEQVRSFLGASVGAVNALRDTARGLLERERLLRDESSADHLAFLEEEQQALESKVTTATDPSVSRSLQSALTALQHQRRQRELVRTSADRLGAELTRMQYTLESIATQLVRLRNAGAESAAQTPEVLQHVQQLHAEVEAITSALEELSAPEQHGLQPVVPVTTDADAASPAVRGRLR